MERRTIRWTWLVAMAVPLVLLAQRADSEATSTVFANPSVVTLIVAPDRFEGKTVVTTGVARVEHEGFRIYLSREDAERRIVENSVRFDPADSAIPLADRE